MFQQHFANYLLEQRRISEVQYQQVLEQQRDARVKLGLIAVAEKLMTPEQGEELNALQRQTDRRFGDLAVEKGYLTPEQLDDLLEKQGNPFLQLVQILTENKILSMEQIEEQLNEYAAEHGFSKKELEVLKSGDLEPIIPILVKTDQPLADEYIGMAVRNVIRFIHNQPLVKNVQKLSRYSFGSIAYQQLVGDRDLWLAFASDGDELLEIACPFAQEAFSEMDEDSFDSVCEFINCVNGLFASELSYDDITLEIMPPEFDKARELSSEDGFYVMPVVLNGKQIDIIAAVNAKVEIN